MSNRIYELSKSEFESLIKSSHNIKEVLFKLKLTTIGNSWAYSLVKKRMSELGLNGGDFIGKSALIHAVYKNKRRDEEIFIENSSVQRPIVRKKIIDENLLEYKCACCGISTWQGKDLSLELDHINGINNDHRLENLRFLCPNCHSQTETYGSKNLNKTFIFRTLNRFEYKQIVAIENIDALYREEIICTTCVLWPRNYDFKAMAGEDGGYPSTLAQIIMENSGFTKEYGIEVL